ncbi:MAG: hypothetical protein AABY22_31085 [Nanoarchaeota archaeon]
MLLFCDVLQCEHSYENTLSRCDEQLLTIGANSCSLLFYGLYGDEISFKSLDNIKSNIHLIISNKLREDIVKKASK